MTDYTHDLNIANADGATVRADINALAAALATNSKSATEPATTLPCQRWNDTTTNTRKRRNLGGTGWVLEGTLDETIVLSRSTNTMLGVSDIGKTIRATSTFTQTFDAAATLGDGWEVEYINEGTGFITFDPNSSETVDGSTTVILGPGERCRIKCNGTNFRTTLQNSVFLPQGRLTLTSGAPVMNADASAQSTIYYALHTGDRIPIYDGTRFVETPFTELSLALDSNSGHTGYHQSGKLFDLFVVNDAGTIRLGTGPAWSSGTSRGTGAGTTELQRLNGLWTNKVSMTLRFGSASGNTITVGANQGTYVGTVYCTANGQTGMQFAPTAASGGTNNVLGLYNAYHRVRTRAICRDSTVSWTYATNSVRNANNSASNRISFVDGLQQSSPSAAYEVSATTNSTTGQVTISAIFDGTNLSDVFRGQVSGTVQHTMRAAEPSLPLLGLHYVQACEQVNGGTQTFFGSPYALLSLDIDI